MPIQERGSTQSARLGRRGHGPPHSRRQAISAGVSALDEVIGRRSRGLAHARQMRMRRSGALEHQLATGQAQVCVEELLPGDVIGLAGNVWVVRDCRLGSDGVCFVAMLGGHVHAWDRSHAVRLLRAQPPA